MGFAVFITTGLFCLLPKIRDYKSTSRVPKSLKVCPYAGWGLTAGFNSCMTQPYTYVKGITRISIDNFDRVLLSQHIQLPKTFKSFQIWITLVKTLLKRKAYLYLFFEQQLQVWTTHLALAILSSCHLSSTSFQLHFALPIILPGMIYKFDVI